MEFKWIDIKMLPTNETTSPIALDDEKNKLAFFEKNVVNLWRWGYQHLYFLSDEKIKTNDWQFDIQSNEISRRVSGSYNDSYFRKIVASTNPLLRLSCPSWDFLKSYVHEYNERNEIQKVQIAYAYKAISKYAKDKLKPYENDYWVSDGEGLIPNSLYLKSLNKEVFNSYGNGYIIDKDIVLMPVVKPNNRIIIKKPRTCFSKEDVLKILTTVLLFSRANNDQGTSKIKGKNFGEQAQTIIDANILDDNRSIIEIVKDFS